MFIVFLDRFVLVWFGFNCRHDNDDALCCVNLVDYDACLLDLDLRCYLHDDYDGDCGVGDANDYDDCCCCCASDDDDDDGDQQHPVRTSSPTPTTAMTSCPDLF